MAAAPSDIATDVHAHFVCNGCEISRQQCRQRAAADFWIGDRSNTDVTITDSLVCGNRPRTTSWVSGPRQDRPAKPPAAAHQRPTWWEPVAILQPCKKRSMLHSPGDTIQVTPGTYTLSAPIDFDGRAITLRGDPADPSLVVLDAQGTEEFPRRVITFQSGETADAIIEGVTITGGFADGSGEERDGGGIYVGQYAGPTIRNCTIEFNHADSSGGGVYIKGQERCGDPTLGLHYCQQLKCERRGSQLLRIFRWLRSCLHCRQPIFCRTLPVPMAAAFTRAEVR